ncbi:hypothetical protein [Prevotella sp. HUN102]|uniref:hypothetical protein n=1 Tax=Prevotella sp. HUN102 TaxID=1392486 RepID=UPI00048C5538|nr:hypothetical protein [Prevotella sp. HUN102]
MTIRNKIILSTLLGFVLPLGSAWGPLLITPDEKNRKFRKRVALYGLCATVFSLLAFSYFWYQQIERLENDLPLDTTNMWIYSMLYVVLMVGFYAYCFFNREK